MLSQNSTERKNICSEDQRFQPKVVRIHPLDGGGSESTSVEDQTLSIMVEQEIGNEIGMLTRSLGNITMSNLKNTYSPVNPNAEYSNFVVDDQILAYVNSGLDDTLIFRGSVFKADNREQNTAVTLSLVSQRELDLEFTTTELYENKKPWELAQILVEQGLGKTFELRQVSSTDETTKTVHWMSYFQDKIFGELKDITEYAESLLYYSPIADKYVYVTREKLKELKTQVSTGTVDFVVNPTYTWDRYDEPVSYLLETQGTRKRENFYNNIKGVYNSYIRSTHVSVDEQQVVYTYRARLTPGEHVDITKKFSKGEFNSVYNWKLTACSAFDDYSGDDYSLLHPEYIDSSVTWSPCGMVGYVKNVHSVPLWVEFTAKAMTVLKPYGTEKKMKNDISIGLFGNKEQQYSSLYCQSFSGLSDYMESKLNYFNSGERESTITITGMPKVELLDRVVVNGGFDPLFRDNDIYGLVKKITHNITPDKGFTTTIVLFYMTYLQA